MKKLFILQTSYLKGTTLAACAGSPEAGVQSLSPASKCVRRLPGVVELPRINRDGRRQASDTQYPR